jgi:ribosome-associated protein
MPNEDAVLILQALDKLQQPHKKEVKVFHKIEEWRDKLLEGDEDIMSELMNKFKNFERQHVNQLIRNSKKEQAMNKPPKSSRLIFKYLSELQDDAE